MSSNLVSEFGHYPVLVGFQLKDEFDVIIWKTGCDMHVKMEHRLSGDSSVVGKDVEPLQIQALHYCSCDNLRDMEDVVQVILRY